MYMSVQVVDYDKETSETALQAYDRCKKKIETMLSRIQRQTTFYTGGLDLLISETQQKWIGCFENRYEDDNQYLKYMFIVMKNRIKDIKADEKQYQSVHVSDPARLSRKDDEGNNASHTRVWNEMAPDEGEFRREQSQIDVAIYNETVENIYNALTSDLQRKIFRCLVQGMSSAEISEEIGYSTGHILQIKVNQIWPIVRDTMRIPYDKYDVLIDSGRIFCR